MSRFLQFFNFLGVCLLAGLCVFQWQANRQLNLQALAQEKTRFEQVAQLAEKDRQIQGAGADLEDFRGRLMKAQVDLSETQSKLTAVHAERDRLSAERDALKAQIDGLKTSLDQWTAAVAVRDQALKQAAEQAQKLGNDRNDTVQKFNDLAIKYNAAADELKQAAQTIEKLIADRNDAVGKFNDLAGKYNRLVNEVNGAASKP